MGASTEEAAAFAAELRGAEVTDALASGAYVVSGRQHEATGFLEA